VSGAMVSVFDAAKFADKRRQKRQRECGLRVGACCCNS